MKTPLASLLLRDGTLYFGLLVVLNAADLTCCFVATEIDIPYFTIALSNIIISRFLLNLRKVNHDNEYGMNGTRPSFVVSCRSEIRFAPSFVGSMGASLNFGPFDDTEPAADEENAGVVDVGGDLADDLDIVEMPRA
ncbi:hypothetical protein BKA93DRAFT_827022 [Sparassis latifolia]